VTLTVLLSIDILVDLFAAVRARHPWLGTAVLLRLILGIGYLAIFMVYVGLGLVFPPNFSYWGIERGYAGPVVYLFLWLIGYDIP
jgi:hypothetical protein